MTKERAYTPSLVLHVLRNTYGWNAEAIRQARLDAADEIERLQTLLIRVLEDGEPSQDLLQEIDEAVTEPTHEPPKIDWDAVEQAKKADAAAFANTWGEIKAHTSEPLPVASRDADHCDYPDCEHHWTNVVAQARAILEPLAECDPAIRQWLKTPDLPKLPGASRDASSALPEEQKALRVQCRCGWQGKVGELTGLSGRYMCPECSRPFEPMPALRTFEQRSGE